MLRAITLFGVLLTMSLGTGLAHARPLPSGEDTPPAPRLSGLAESSPIYHSNTSSRPGKAVDPQNSVYLYGGPDTLEGKFETFFGAPDWQGWTSVDMTLEEPYWQISEFNATNLNFHGPGNHAYWAGRTAEQEPGWAASPGYGNNWNTVLAWTSGPLADPSIGQTVDLDFFFNHQTEPGYDYFIVEYDSAGTWMQGLFLSGGNGGFGEPFDPPGVIYSEATSDWSGPAPPIVFTGNDYGGANGDEIRIRLRVTSDGAFSDEDGLWPTDGAVQVDDISVSYHDGVQPRSTFDDFEGAGPFSWKPVYTPFFGDFAKIFRDLSDTNPCASNVSPQMTFIDDGTPPRNVDKSPVPWTGEGSTSFWGYGVPGGYVVPYLSSLDPYDYMEIQNEVWSPPIAWDLPGTEDDAMAGAQLGFTMWNHLPVPAGHFAIWNLRSSTDSGATWGDWTGRNILSFGGGDGEYRRMEHLVTDLIDPAVTHVQVSLAVVGLCGFFAFPCTDKTPAPWFDDVSLLKFGGGPSITAGAEDLFQDTFPPSGDIDPLADPNLLACRFDMARELSSTSTVIPGDSMVVDVVPTAPGATLARLEMHWVLDLNPLFAGVREMPPGTTVIAAGAENGRDQWMGTVTGQQSTKPFNQLVANRYFFDMPYEGPSLFAHQNDGPETMFFPGDVCRFYIEAEDDQGHVSTLPADVTHWGSGNGYSREFVVRALPSLADDGGGGITQPDILLINDDGRFGSEDVYVHAFRQNGLHVGEHADLYAVRAPNRGRSNGIGAEHRGANVAQLGGYRCIFYMGGIHTTRLLSDGSGVGHSDKSDDLGVLTGWHELAGDRFMAHFADNIASVTDNMGAAGADYVQNILSVLPVGWNVRFWIDDQSAPVILPVSPSFSQPVVAYGGCPKGPQVGPDVLQIFYPQDQLQKLHEFDAIQPIAPAVTGHGYEMLAAPGSTYPDFAASVIHDRMDGADRKVDMTFPFDLSSVFPTVNKMAESSSALLVAEILAYFDAGHVGGDPVASNPPVEPGIHRLRVEPNPFNPATSLRFHVGTQGRYTVDIYNVRGERVAIVHDGVLEAGPQELRWDGRDDRDMEVASGVYLVEISGEGSRETIKIALLR